MALDHFRPVMYRINIDGTDFDGSAPADGFIDPTPVEKYMTTYTLTGSSTVSGVTANDTIHIDETAITFNATDGTNIAGVIISINVFTDVHHVVASDNGSGKLVLTNQDGYEGNAFSVIGDTAILAKIGFVTPVLSTIPGDAPSDLDAAEAKARGNIRWQNLVRHLSRDCTPLFIDSIVKPGADVNTPPSSISLTVAYGSNTQVTTVYDEYDNSVLEGIQAIELMVVRAIIEDRTQLIPVYDPTTYEGSTGNIVRGIKMENLNAAPLTDDLETASGAFTVTVISHSR